LWELRVQGQGQLEVALPTWQQQSQLVWHRLVKWRGEGLFGGLMLKPQKADGELTSHDTSPFWAILFWPPFIALFSRQNIRAFQIRQQRLTRDAFLSHSTPIGRQQSDVSDYY
jgi:hypothetical protein